MNSIVDDLLHGDWQERIFDAAIIVCLVILATLMVFLLVLLSDAIMANTETAYATVIAHEYESGGTTYTYVGNGKTGYMQPRYDDADYYLRVQTPQGDYRCVVSPVEYERVVNGESVQINIRTGGLVGIIQDCWMQE